MTNKSYRKALDAAFTELEELLHEEERIQNRMLSVRKTINALSILCQEAGEHTDFRERASATMLRMLEGSITEDIFKVLRAAKEPLTTSEVRDELKKLGSLGEHKNPLATINAVINRLVEQGKLMETLKSGRKAWQTHENWFSSMLRGDRSAKKQ